MTPWDKVLAATEGHDLDDIHMVVDEDRPWLYLRCACGAGFTERWEFTDHIRRLVFAALQP